MTDARGFTLIELVVAIAVTGLVLLLTHALFTAVLDASARAHTMATEATTAANRQAWLHRAFASAVTGSRPQRGFRGVRTDAGAGERDEVTFYSHVRAASGLTEQGVHLSVSGERLIAEVSDPETGPDTLVLAEHVTGFGADYLLEFGADARWVANWLSPVSAPLAVRLRVTHEDTRADTALYVIGPRG